jgi:hypothetical protein
VLADLTGESLGWGEVYLDEPVSSSTGVINAVFEMPAWTERTAQGVGGGPGLGYVESSVNGHAWISLEGVQWVQLHGNYEMMVTPIAGGASRSLGAPKDLSSLVSTVPEGWWTNPEVKEQSVVTVADDPSVEVPLPVSAASPLHVFPNPFNPRTKISYYVDTRGRVSVDVFDIRGRRVKRIASRVESSGAHSLVWQGDDQNAKRVASGVYFVRLVTPDDVAIQRVALVR